MRGQSVLRADSLAWPKAPAYAVPAMVTQRRLSTPIACRAAARIGTGSRYPGGSGRCVATTAPVNMTAVKTANALDMTAPRAYEMAVGRFRPVMDYYAASNRGAAVARGAAQNRP